MARCQRCGRFKRNDGILICPRHGPVRQDATVRPRTIGGDSSVSRDNPPTSSTQRAVVGKGKRKLVAKLDRGKWTNDRQAYETREIVTDKEADFYRQEWTDPITGDTTFRKRDRLKDQDMHGPASHQPTSPRTDDGQDATRPSP